MNSFPSTISKPLQRGFKESISKPVYKTSSESGYDITKPKGFLARKSWDMQWSAMNETDYEALQTFFVENSGLIFEWTHPITDVIYKVRFSQEDFTGTHVAPGLYEVSITIGEV